MERLNGVQALRMRVRHLPRQSDIFDRRDPPGRPLGVPPGLLALPGTATRLPAGWTAERLPRGVPIVGATPPAWPSRVAATRKEPDHGPADGRHRLPTTARTRRICTVRSGRCRAWTVCIAPEYGRLALPGRVPSLRARRRSLGACALPRSVTSRTRQKGSYGRRASRRCSRPVGRIADGRRAKSRNKITTAGTWHPAPRSPSRAR